MPSVTPRIAVLRTSVITASTHRSLAANRKLPPLGPAQWQQTPSAEADTTATKVFAASVAGDGTSLRVTIPLKREPGTAV
jgi:hypothetical protein